MNDEAIGLIEFRSVARGILATDAVVKKAAVSILKTHPICPGKYILLFSGMVGDVEESLKKGLEVGGDLVVDDLLLPGVHVDVIPAMLSLTVVDSCGSIGVVETFSVASCVVAADIAAKATPAKLVEIRLASGLGGKAYFLMTGELCDIEASIGAASNYARSEGLLAGCEIIEDPHEDVVNRLLYW